MTGGEHFLILFHECHLTPTLLFRLLTPLGHAPEKYVSTLVVDYNQRVTQKSSHIHSPLPV